MNSLKLLFSDTNNSQEIYDLINVCKEEIEKIKNINKKEKNSESIIEIFENKLMEYKSKNDANMSGELSQVLNQFFDNFLIFEIKMKLIYIKMIKLKNIKNMVCQNLSWKEYFQHLKNMKIF